MTLVARLRLARAGLAVVVVGGAFAAAYATSSAFVFALGVPVAWLVRGLPGRWVVHSAARRFAKLVEAGALAEARTVLGELRACYVGTAPKEGEWLQFYEATLLIGEGRYAEARSLLESIDRTRIPPTWVPWVLSNLSFALVHTGDPSRAIVVAQESLDLVARKNAGASAAYSDDLRSSQLGTMGAALVVAGKPEEGIPLLEQALARGGRPRAKAARIFFLGEALKALGRHEEARAAYRRAVETSPSTPHGAKAKVALEAMSAYR